MQCSATQQVACKRGECAMAIGPLVRHTHLRSGARGRRRRRRGPSCQCRPGLARRSAVLCSNAGASPLMRVLQPECLLEACWRPLSHSRSLFTAYKLNQSKPLRRGRFTARVTLTGALQYRRQQTSTFLLFEPRPSDLRRCESFVPQGVVFLSRKRSARTHTHTHYHDE